MAKKIRKSEVGTASSEDAFTFVETLQKAFRGRKRSPEERERLRKYLAKYSPEYLRSIARRVTIDIVKGPGQPTAYGDKSPPQPPPPSRQGRGTASMTGGTGAKATRRPGGKRATGTGKFTAARSRRKSGR